jgi:tetrahydromethanopterin S-methyltransferase subunit E
MNDLISEPMGFKFTVGGFTTWLASLVQGADLTQTIGFIALLIGLVIQVVSFYRNNKTEQRAKEADDRDKAQYELQMRILAKELHEIEKRLGNDSPK